MLIEVGVTEAAGRPQIHRWPGQYGPIGGRPEEDSNNIYWCTDQRANHIDVSCSAFTELTNGSQDIDNIGSLNVWVRQVDCSVGLGVQPLVR